MNAGLIIALVFLFFIITLFCTFFTARLAQLKKQNKMWGIAGLLLGVFGIVIVSFLPSKRDDNMQTNPILHLAKKLPALFKKIANCFMRVYKALFIKKEKRIISVLAIAVVIALVIGVVTAIKVSGANKADRVKAYNVVETYKAEEQKNSANAILYLSDGIYQSGDKVLFKNGKGDVFELEKTESGYNAKTVKNGVADIAFSKTLSAYITTKGELVLNGYLLYSQYESQKVEFNNEVVAKNVEYCTFTDNSLLYITTDKKLFALGFNEYGQLGDTTTKNKAEPTLVKENVKRCSISDTHSFVIDKFDTLVAVGDNSFSQLGTKNAISTTEYQTIMQGIKQAEAGNFYSLILAVNGELYSAGTNDKNQLGIGSKDSKAGLNSLLKGVKKIKIYKNTCAALTNSNELYVWGDDANVNVSEKRDTLPQPVKVCKNVYDFAIGARGITIIDNNRDVMVFENGEVVNAVVFGSTIVPKEQGNINEPEPESV